jgi:two-component system C4-dicarboxylate transport response regulator DctD
LSQRREDIPELFVFLLRQAAAKLRVTPIMPSASFLSELSARDWPGNVRELRNAVDRYALGIDNGPTEANDSRSGTLPDRLAAFERQAIVSELMIQKGHLKPTYLALGLSRKTLYEKMQKHGLSRDDFREER